VKQQVKRLPRPSQLLLTMALILTVMGVAGFFLHSFAYPLALGLAAFFGVSGAASSLARSPHQRGVVFGSVLVLALVGTYVFVVSGGGGPPSPTPSR